MKHRVVFIALLCLLLLFTGAMAADHPTVLNPTYNGQEQALFANPDGETWVYQIEGTWGETVPTGKDAGTYEFPCSIKGESPATTCTGTIEPAKAKVTTLPVLISGPLTYNGAKQELLATRGAANNGTIHYILDNNSAWDSTQAQYVGTHTVSWYVEPDENYTHQFTKDNAQLLGSVEIKPLDVTVTITGNTGEFIYNGADRKVEGYEVSIDKELYTKEDFKFDGEAKVTKINVGDGSEKPMGLAKEQFTNKNNNFNVTFEVTDGSIKINKLHVDVTINGDIQTHVYDGAEHSAEGWTIESSSDLYKPEYIEFNGTAKASRMVKGTTPMGLSVSQFSNKTNTPANNFDPVFTVKDGYMQITAVNDVVVTIKGKRDWQTYDGNLHTLKGYVVKTSNPAYTEDKFKFTGSTDEVSGKEAGTYTLGLDATQFVNLDTANFAKVVFTIERDTELVIQKRPVTVTITGHKDEVTYNTTSHKVEGYDVVISDSLYTKNDFTFNGQAKIEEIKAGTYEMGLAVEQFTNNKENNFDVTFDVTDGELKINKCAVNVAITGNTNAATYDGSEHSVDGYVFERDKDIYTEADFKFTGTASAKRTVKGTTPMNLAESQFTNINDNFEVTFSVTDGYQKITAIDEVDVTIKGYTWKVTYDGKEKKVAGYQVVSSNPLYTEADFTFSGKAEIVETNAGTYVMGLAPDQFVNKNPNFAKVTFNVTDGWLTIDTLPVTVTITGNTADVEYTGTQRARAGYTATADNALYDTEANISFNGKARVTGTDAGTYNMGLSEINFENTNRNFAPVTFKVTDGWLKINPIEVTVAITGNNAEITYDGIEHARKGYKASASNDLYVPERDLSFNGNARVTGTDAGTYYMHLDASQFTNKNSNFYPVHFTIFQDGWLKINPLDVTVTITGTQLEAPYDGKEHTAQGYTAEISDKLYKEEYFHCDPEAKVTRTDAGTDKMNLTPERFVNHNSNFNVTFAVAADGSMTITPIAANVTITGKSNTAVYDGKEHSISGYEWTADTNLYKQEYFTFSGIAKAARTDEGTTNMNLSADQFTNISKNFSTVTFNVTDGYQTITPIDEVVVSIKGYTWNVTYDGKEKRVAGYQVVNISNPLYKETDFEFTGTAEIKKTDAGTYEMGLTADQFRNKNTNFNKVTFKVTDGWLKIDPLAVKVTVKGTQKTEVYDNTEHTAEGWSTISISDPLYKEAYFTGPDSVVKQTNFGKVNMGLKADQFTNNNPNFTVTFEIEDGFIEITKRAVTVKITGNQSSLDYNGKNHTVDGYVVKISDSLYTESDFNFIGTASATRRDAGTEPMGLNKEQFINNNTNFDVTFDVVDGYQRINQINVTVTIIGKNNTTEYDGNPHTVERWDFSSSNPLYTEADITFNGTDSVTRTDVGTTKMRLNKDQFNNANPNFSTVTFNVTDGYQTITPVYVTVTITGHKDTKNYDGLNHTVSGYDFSATSKLYLEEYLKFSGEAKAVRNAAGTKNMGLTKEQFENTNDNFKIQTINVTDGYMEILPIDVTVTIEGKNNTAPYDGKEHKVEGYAVKTSTPLYTEKDFTFSGTAEAVRTDQGTTNMGLTAAQFNNTNPNFANVTFNVMDGYQTITPIDEVWVNIKGVSNTTVYDGAEHSVSGYYVDFSNTLYTKNDFIFSGTDTAKRTEAGKTMMGLSADQFTNTNKNFDKVNFLVTDGYQEITQRKVTVKITGHNGTFQYNKQAQAVAGYDVSINDDVYKDSYINFSGNASVGRKDVGTTYMGLKADQFTNTNTNFNVTFEIEDGYITITPVDGVVVTIKGHFNTTEYNGNEHTISGYEFSASNALYTKDDYSFSGTAEAKRTDAGKTMMELDGKFKNINENFINVTFNITDGYQEILPISVTVTITGNHDTWPYDGEEHQVTGYKVEVGNPLYKESDFTFSGTASASRTEAGTSNMGLKPENFSNKSANFKDVTFSVTDGYVQIDPRPVTVTIIGNTDTVEYDGKEHTVSGYVVTCEEELYDTSKISFTGSDTVSGTNVGTYEMDLKDKFENADTNFEVTFNVTNGSLNITAVEGVTVTITGKTLTDVYDGQEKTVEGYTVAIEPSGLYTEADFDFTGEAKASGTDAATYMMELTEDQFANKNENFKDVTFVVEDGYLQIDPKDLSDLTVRLVLTPIRFYANGQEKTVSYTVTDIQTGKELVEGVDYELDPSSVISAVDKGVYTVTITANDKLVGHGAKAVSGSNYTGTASANWSIVLPEPPNTIHFFEFGQNGIYDLNQYGNQLPATGFPTRVSVPLSVRPEGLDYAKLNMRLQIPSIGVDSEIAGVPTMNDQWLVEWLGAKAGLLSGSSVPGEGYSIIAGHNTLNNTEYGPFARLSELSINDLIVVSTGREVKNFRIFANERLASDDMPKLLSIAEQEADTLVLVTCENESKDGGYLNRRVVFAKPF